MILPFHIRSKFTFLRFIFLGPDTSYTNTILDGIKPCNFFQMFFQIKNEQWAPLASATYRTPWGSHRCRSGSSWNTASVLWWRRIDLFCSKKESKYIIRKRGVLFWFMYWRHLEISSMQFMMTAHIFLDSVLSSMDILRIGKECKKNKNCFLFWSGETWLAISCVMLHSFQSVTYWSNDAIW